jgi:hypothetical protein
MMFKIKRYLSGFSAETGIQGFCAHEEVLYEMIERIEKRRIYFYVFYNGTRLGELNEGSLLCFWILKLMPFYHPQIPAYIINANIALAIFVNSLNYYAGLVQKKVNLTDQAVKDLQYAFCFRDLSKEAIMILAENLIY